MFSVVLIDRPDDLKELQAVKALEDQNANDNLFQKLKLQGEEVPLRNYMFKNKLIKQMTSKPTVKQVSLGFVLIFDLFLVQASFQTSLQGIRPPMCSR